MYTALSFVIEPLIALAVLAVLVMTVSFVKANAKRILNAAIGAITFTPGSMILSFYVFHDELTTQYILSLYLTGVVVAYFLYGANYRPFNKIKITTRKKERV